jgi:hypothetical protein
MTFTGASNTSYIDEEVAMPSAEGSQTVRAVTDESDGSPIVAITSLSDTTQRIDVLCIVEHEHRQKSIELGPQETLVTEACEAKTRPGWDLQAILDHAEEAPRGVAGISITSDGMPGSFAAFGLSRRTKDGRQSFSSIDFADPMMTMSPNTVFTGIPVGAAPLLGDGKFVPELSLANFSDQSRHVTVKFAHTSGATPATSDVADLALEPGTIKRLKLEGLEADPTLQNSFFVGSDGVPGDLLAKLVSVNDSDSEMQVVGILGKDEREMYNGGNHPWSIENGSDSTILLFNHSTKPQPFYLLISSNSVQWQRVYTLAPMQTEAINVRQLIDDQTKDDNGKVLPKNGQSGQVGWWNQDRGLGKGRLLLSDRENGMARSFSCSILRGLCAIIYNQQITTFANGNTVVFASAIAVICEVYAINQCNGTADTGTGGYTTSWSSQNSAIASISGPSNQSTVSLYGTAIGATTVNVVINSPYCTVNGGGPANVTAKIRLGGASGPDITGLIQSAVVGQQIVLYADYTLPSGEYANSQSWSVPGTRVGGFGTAPTNGGPIAINNNGQSTTFYWVTAANSQTAVFTLKYGSNQTLTAQTTFNIAGPTLSSFTAATPGQVNTDQILMYFGGPSGNGVSFTATVNPPSGYNGSQVWGQTIGSVAINWTGSNTYSCSGSGLDTSWPWTATIFSSPPNTTNANDNPQAPVSYPKYNQVTFSQQNNSMYLLWQPTLSGASIPVPIAKISWSWYGQASYNGAQWQIVGQGTTSKGTVGSYTNSSSYPIWTSAFVPAAQCKP